MKVEYVMEFLKNNKKMLVIALTVLCIVMAFVTARFRTEPTIVENALAFVVIPVQKAALSVSGWVAGKFRALSDLPEIEAENKRLRTMLEEINAENFKLSLVEKENEKLSALLQLKQKYESYETLGAEIVSKDMGNWYDRFTIDKGTKHGLDRNMVVLASGGLVGTIIESGYTSSKVISLIDNTSSIAAKSVRTDDIGFVKGDLDLMKNGYCKMEHIDIDADILEGDDIVTSQLSDIYPPGIIIGKVKEIRTDSNGLTKHAVIDPVVDFKHLETVLVIYEYMSGSEVEE